MIKVTTRSAFFMIAAMILLSGCLDDIHYNMPCQLPTTLEENEVTGTWSIEYSEYKSPHFRDATVVNGTEQIDIYPDGTYRQSFQSDDYSYDGPVGNWNLDSERAEGSKLIMHNLKYYAYGVEQIGDTIELGPQTPDRLRYKKSRSNTGIQSDILVNYPYDGFVYLYPRRCLGK